MTLAGEADEPSRNEFLSEEGQHERAGEAASGTSGRFRFKSKRKREDDDRPPRSRKRHVKDSDDAESTSRRYSRRHHRDGRHKTQIEEEDPTSRMDAETAFRESLFDAMADDEGAAFWEGVYGQPIHTYPNTKPADPENPDSELERMSDEEYAAYVRIKMWEKTHEHVIEERKRREEAARRKSEGEKRSEQKEREREEFGRRMEESLRRGEERRNARAWKDAWAAYVRGWEKLFAGSRGRSGDEDVKAHAVSVGMIPWPVRSGKAEDVSKEAVESFFEHAPGAGDHGGGGLRRLLKSERVRWHPDKMQQRFAGAKLDSKTATSVTAVFQIVDALWSRSGT